MPKKGVFLDIAGQRFNRWTAISCVRESYRDESGKKLNTLWECVCDCGTVSEVPVNALRSGTSRSCGCLKVEVLTTHGMCKETLYGIWTGICTRCFDTSHVHYDRYGGRGIGVEPTWVSDVRVFIAYVRAALGERSSMEHTIDRIDNDRGYEPGNLKWSTRVEQANNRSSTRWVTIGDTTLPLTLWCERLDVNRAAVGVRLQCGWDVIKALTTPTSKGFMRRKAQGAPLEQQT